MSTAEIMELLKMAGFAVSVYLGIRTDMIRIQAKVDNHGETLARHERMLEKD